jgi:hypothetical protein
MNNNLYDDLLPGESILMPKQATAFNGDSFVAAEFLKLKQQFNIKIAVELGSCVMGTTKWLAENFDKVITVEINPEFRNIGLERIKPARNVTSMLGDSVNMLPAMLQMCDSNPIIFIDSHWQTLPLFDELNIIKASGLKPVIVIHDFLVPNEPSLGFDSYEGVDISFENIKPHIEAIYGIDGYSYYYNTAATATEVKRGLCYIYAK